MKNTNYYALAFIIIISIASLCQVHYNYTGKISTINGIVDVENHNYKYPYYSDEWNAIALVGKNPFKNPMHPNESFTNFTPIYHLTISSLLFLFNPLTSFVILSIIINTLLIITIYFVLKKHNVNDIVAIIASLSALLITNGSNLPTLWTLLPITFGILFLLLSFVRWQIFFQILSMVFYPPMMIFFIISIFYTKKTPKYILIYSMILLSIILSFIMFTSKFLFFDISGGSASFTLWSIVPIFVIAISMIKFSDKKWLNYSLVLGIILWIVYSFTKYRLIIGYDRIVYVTSILMIVSFGFGLQKIYDYAKSKKYDYIFKIILVIFIFMPLAIIPLNNWDNLKLGEYSPNPPANQYLIDEDIDLFSEIHRKTFLSPPWKGLVIGTATDNYPIKTKDATITNKLGSYDYFMNQECYVKRHETIKIGIDYVYGNKFECEGFELMGVSSEDLHLYKVK